MAATTNQVQLYSKRDLEDLSLEIEDIASDEELAGAANTGTALNPSTWGTVLSVPTQAVNNQKFDINPGFGTTSAPSQTLSTPSFPTERDMMIILKPIINTAIYGPAGSGTGSIIAVINYVVGGILITKKLILTSTVTRFIELSCRSAQVYCYLNAPPAATTVQVNAAIVPGHHKQAASYGWSTLESDAISAAGGVNLWVGEGVLGSATFLITAAGGASSAAPQYIMAVDKTTALSSGADFPVPCFTTPQVVAAGQYYVLSDDIVPGAIGWSNGLTLAASTTIGTYTAPATPCTFSVQLKIGR